MVNVGGLIAIVFIVMALVWGFWLIFKQGLFSMNLGKLAAYFLGVIITLTVVAWMASRFLPWWTLRLVDDTSQSQHVQDLEDRVQDLLSNTIPDSGPIVIAPTARPTPIPGTTPAATVSPVATPQTNVVGQSAPAQGETNYTVQMGDTLYSLSRRYGVSVDAIRQRNGLPNSNIQAGQTLIIPAP